MKLIRKICSDGVEWICLILMAALAVDLMLGVFSRYVLFRTFTWYDEIARACFVWVVFLGAAVGVKRGSHFGLHLFVDRAPAWFRRAAAILTPLIVIAFSAVLVVQGLAFLEFGRFQQLPVMGVSKVWIYAAMPTGGALMILYSLPGLWRGVRALRA
ncbi:MAG TPA: TRAP transporter small permease [Xanthobacteraceae bacterium]